MRKTIAISIFLLVACSSSWLFAQGGLYDAEHIPEIRIYFEEENWDAILDSFYVAGEEERLLGAVEIDGTRLEGAGIRYKGFSSVSTNRIKNPFNISLDYATPGQEYQGINKIKLSNVIQDPSFLREVLTYEIAREYMPASRANFARVWVNDYWMGLYTNVEAVNKDFVEDWYGSRDMPFFKCNPEELDFDGENSELSNVHGSDPFSYVPYYDMKSDEGWEELYHLIDTLNEHPEHISKILNVDRTLWMHALNYALVNFDSYIGYAQNYYLYRDATGRWNPILWDLNMSFGSYRFSDASLYWNGFTIEDAKVLDPLAHYNSVSVFERPLLRNLFVNPTYRRMFLAHIRTIIEENIVNQDYYLRGLVLQQMIDADVAADTNKFYSYADFQDNLTLQVSDLIDYPGLTELMDARATYLSAYPGYQGAPMLTNAASSPVEIHVGEDAVVTARVEDADSVILYYRSNVVSPFQGIEMLDDGLHGDGAAGDLVYGATMTRIGYGQQYYLYAENDSSGRFLPEDAAFHYFSLSPKLIPGYLVINEVMADNQQTVTDPEGEYDAWIELYNQFQYPIEVDGVFLSDDPDQLEKWPLPTLDFAKKEYVQVWADEEVNQSGLHTNFKLDAAGGQLYLSYAGGYILDSLVYGPQDFVTSYGRYPNGVGPFVEMLPTFGLPNKRGSDPVLDADFFCFPQPADASLNLKFGSAGNQTLEIYQGDGRLLVSGIEISATSSSFTLATEEWASGLYFIRLCSSEGCSTQKIIISH